MKEYIKVLPGGVSQLNIFDQTTDSLEELDHSVFTTRLSSTIGGNREIKKLYTTSQVSNITRKT